MDEHGNFEITCDVEIQNLYLLPCDESDDILASLDLSFMAAQSIEKTHEVEENLTISDIEGLICPGHLADVPAPV
jgi:hypothetical protein